MRSEAGAEVDVIFTVVVCDKKGAVLRQLGAAHLPLDGVLAAGRDEPLGPRVVKSLDGDEVGSLSCAVKAFDALEEIEETADLFLKYASKYLAAKIEAGPFAAFK